MFNFFSGYVTVLKYFFRKKVTISYPKEKNIRSNKFRGAHILDNKLCAKCKTCEKACINNCISIGDRFQIDYSTCCFCGRCVKACPTKALYMSKDDVHSEVDKKMFVKYLDGEK